MSETQRLTDIETLARMAARLAGRDADEHVNIRLAGVRFSKAWSGGIQTFWAVQKRPTLRSRGPQAQPSEVHFRPKPDIGGALVVSPYWDASRPNPL